MKMVIIAILALGMAGCETKGFQNSTSTDPIATPGNGAAPPDPAPTPVTTPVVNPTTPVTTIVVNPVQAPDEFVVPAPAPQLSFAQVSSNTLYARAGDAVSLSFTLDNPTGQTPKCNWYREILPQTLMPSGDPKAQFGTVNGTCAAFVHNQVSQISFYRYTVYISAGASTLSYQWDVNYVSSAANVAVSITDSTAAGTYRIYDTQKFSVTVDDKDRDGICSWKIDGVEKSTSCVSYNAPAAAGTRALSFSVHDGSTSDSKSWTLKPAAKITDFTPASVNVANNAHQIFTATLSDTNSAGATCQFAEDGNVVQTGACSFNYTGNGSAHTITVQAMYGAEASGTLSTAHALGPINNTVLIKEVIPAHTSEVYFAQGENTNTFGVSTWDDVDGDGVFEWYLNGIKTNCASSTKCHYTSAAKNGIALDNFSVTTVIKVVLTDGQYSSSKTWLAHTDHVTFNENVPGSIGNTSGDTMTLYGTGFESTDVFTIQSLNIPLQIVSVSDTVVTLKVSNVNTGAPGALQKLRVKKTWNSDQSLTGTTGSTVESSVGYIHIGN